MTKIFLIDGFNKSLFLNVFSIYLKKYKSEKKYTLIDIHDFTDYTPQKIDSSSNFISISKKKLINPYKFINYVKNLYDNNKFDFIFIFNVSRLIFDHFEDTIYDEVYFNLIHTFTKNNTNRFFLKKENNLFTMNKFLCTIRINDINSFTNTFMPFGGYLLFNYLECLAIENYYNIQYPIFKEKSINYTFENLFKFFLQHLNVPYNQKQMKSIITSYLIKIQTISIGIILLIIITHLMFYTPYYLFIIRKIKNNKINKQNKFFFIILLLLPITLLIIPSWSIFFIPEIINFMALYKIYHS